ncbi:MAG: DUF1573 domain-containing protein [Ignavibacteriales bacterium]|nr:DUF1573 domain-containing protein [Ignavibacteriales bacterium]
MCRCFSLLLILAAGFDGLLSQAKIVVEHPVVEMGTLFQGEVRNIVIPIRNAGVDTLLVKEVTTSCGCTVARASRFSVAPGADATVEATFNSTGFQGPLTKIVTIRTNDTASPYTPIRINFDVVAEIIPSDNLYNLWIGNVALGKSLRKTISFKNVTEHAMIVAGGTSPSSDIKVYPHTGVLKAGETGSADIDVTPAKDGYAQAEVRIELSGTGQSALVMRMTYFGLKEP